MGFFREGVRNNVGGSKAGTVAGHYRKRGSFSNSMREGSKMFANVDKNEEKIKVYYCNSCSVRNKID